jgi:predicted enzyme related to lactoylglutathione lyase
MMQPGKIGWVDLTVEDAPSIRDFYRQVTGWTVDELSMGDYSDFVMKCGEEAVAGVCHARGSNAGQPSGWMIYIVVEDLDQSLAACQEAGGRVRVPVRDMGGEGRFAVIEDPSGSVCALYQGA